MQYFKVFCADCHRGYEQGGYKPIVCGLCGSDWVAVKAATAADLCGTSLEGNDVVEPWDGLPAESVDNGPPYDAATATGMYDHY